MKADLTVVVYGRRGCGKSALIGEIAELVLACGGQVRCLAGKTGERKRPVRQPDADKYHAALNVELVEIVGGEGS